MVEYDKSENHRGGRAMTEYLVTAQIALEVEATDEDEAKDVAVEQLGDFLIHHNFADLMKVEKL